MLNNRSRVAALASRCAATAFLGTAALAMVNCGSSSGSPTSPSSLSSAAPPPGAVVASVQVSVAPNPVPFSGAPITDTPCVNYADTWFYDTVLQEFGGNTVTFTSRIDLFDGKTANNVTDMKLVIAPHATLTLHTRWCSGAPTAHQAQSIFSGTDSTGATVSVTGAVAQLMARGK